MIQQWFKEAKLGVFVHWGIYSVYGVTESWSFYRERISYKEYMKQCEGFKAEKYNPSDWAELFKKAGAKYAVLTSKHHDGVALWDTKLSELNVVKKTPAARDLIEPFCDALRHAGIKTGLYFSHLDWSHPDYASVFKQERRKNPDAMPRNRFSDPQGPEDFEAWHRFLKFHRGQLKELMTNFGTIDLLWFDGDWERDAEQWQMAELRDFLHGFNNAVVLNSRMKGYGDYATPEQGVPILAPAGPWEFCVTINNSWGYQPQDKNYKSVRQIIRMFAECIGMGGNMLLGIGPRPDGTIDTEQEKRLLALGDWIKEHEEAVYSTTAGLPAGHFYGASTLSKDACTLYLFLFDRPWENFAVKGIRNDIKGITVLSSGQKLNYKKIGGAAYANLPGVLWVDIEEQDLNEYATVIKVELEGQLDLYREAGETVESN